MKQDHFSTTSVGRAFNNASIKTGQWSCLSHSYLRKFIHLSKKPWADLPFPQLGWGGGGEFLNYHIKRTGQLVVHLRLFNLERPTVRAFVVPFRVLSKKKLWQEMSSFRIGTFWGWKISSHAHKTRSCYLLVLFKISDEHPRPFYVVVSPPSPPRQSSASRILS